MLRPCYFKKTNPTMQRTQTKTLINVSELAAKHLLTKITHYTIVGDLKWEGGRPNSPPQLILVEYSNLIKIFGTVAPFLSTTFY